jgi:ATP-binding cassette subfamily B protein
MTIRSILLKLLSPIWKAKRKSFLQWIVLFTRPLQWIVAVYITKLIIESLEQQDVERFQQLLVWFGVYIVLDKIWQYYTRDWTRVTMQEVYENIIYSEYVPKYLSLDHNYTEKKGTWYIMSVLEKWVETRSEAIRDIFRYGLDLLVTIGFVVYSFLQLDMYVRFSFYAAIVVCVIMILYISQYILPMRKIEAELKNIRSRFFAKIIMSKSEILQSNNITTEIHKLADIKWQIVNQKKSRSALLASMYIIPEGLVNMLKLTVLAMLWYTVIVWTGQLSALVLVLWAISLMEWAISNFTTFYKDLQTHFARITNLWSLIDNGPTIDLEHWSLFQYSSWSLHLSHTTFAYEDAAVFTDFSLHIQWGKKTALVGPSGWGKSTLIKLIAGYLRPDTGDIIIDEQKLSDVSLLSYYKHIGYLTQEPSVFDGTIRENLEYWLSSQPITASEAKQSIKSIISLAKCERIYNLSNGLDTEIGERGVRLSWWQKQRLAIAKIMLKNPDIILLDEPTSALDSENEQAVTEALNNLFQWKTVIIIAHRLQTVKHADDIIYIADGWVVERGTHSELLALQWEYYKMVELQSGF